MTFYVVLDFVKAGLRYQRTVFTSVCVVYISLCRRWRQTEQVPARIAATTTANLIYNEKGIYFVPGTSLKTDPYFTETET